MNKIIFFLLLLFGVGVALGLIDQYSTSTDIENSTSQILGGFFNFLELGKSLGSAVLNTVGTVIEGAKSLLENIVNAAKDTWNWFVDLFSIFN